LHKKDWLKIGAGVGLAVAAPYALPALAGAGGAAGAGLLGGEAAAGLAGAAAVPEAGAALAGASGLTDLAGASGGALASAPSVASPSLLSGLKMGVQNAGFNMGLPTGWDSTLGKGLKMAGNGMRFGGLLGGQQQPQGGGMQRPPPQGQFGNTSIYGGRQVSGINGMVDPSKYGPADPNDPDYMRKMQLLFGGGY